MGERLDAARELAKQGRFEEAAVEFEWLWDNMEHVEPDMSGVRVSFMAGDIGELVGKHPPARERFTQVRDRTAALADADLPSGAGRRFDWIVLNEILSERERTLAWFDGVKDDERYATVVDKVSTRLVPLLKSHNRLRDIGLLYRNPVGTFVETHRMLQMPPHVAADPYPDPDPKLSPKMQDIMRQMLRMVLDGLTDHIVEDAALMVTCLLAADRTTDADAVEREARRLDPSEKMRAALEKARGRLD